MDGGGFIHPESTFSTRRLDAATPAASSPAAPVVEAALQAAPGLEKEVNKYHGRARLVRIKAVTMFCFRIHCAVFEHWQVSCPGIDVK